MNEEEKAALEQQRQRRNRITRMKNVVIAVVAGWMVVSFLAIIILTVQVVRLNYRIDKLTIRNESSVETSIQEEQTELENTESMNLQAETTNMPADMDAEENLAKEGDEHKVYLTFDGGPDENTNEILDVLAKYNVKATFFVIGKLFINELLMKDIRSACIRTVTVTARYIHRRRLLVKMLRNSMLI